MSEKMADYIMVSGYWVDVVEMLEMHSTSVIGILLGVVAPVMVVVVLIKTRCFQRRMQEQDDNPSDKAEE